MSETAIGEEQLPTPGEPPERGRRALHVFEIPWQGWKDILARVGKEIRRDNLDIVAAGVTFYAVLAIGPAFVALVSIYGLFASPTDVQQLLEPMFQLVPPGGGRTLIESLLQSAVSEAPQALSLRAALGILLSLWSANRGMKALIAAVSLAYEEPERRGFVAENLLSLTSMVAVVAVLALTSAAVIALPALMSSGFSLIGESLAKLLALLRWPVLFLVVVVGLSALYHYAPARRRPKWRWVSLGSVIGTIFWLLFSGAISLYARYASQAPTGHEALDSVIALLLWMFASAWAILLGAELNAEIEHQTARDSTVGLPKRIGERGAYVADNIGDG